MMLPDVNVLLHAHRADADEHRAYRGWLEELVNAPHPFGLADAVLSGFLRVATHPAVFKPATPVADAIAFVDALRGADNAVMVAPGTRHWAIFRDLCLRARARGNDVPDAFLAALAIEHRCEWVTADRGFARFPGLRWRHPLDEAS